MQRVIKILETSISDVGYWSWWASEFPDLFQLEFGGVQLWNPPMKENQAPSGLLALRFLDPISVSTMTRNNDPDLEKNWFELIHDDEIDPFNLDHDAFVINDVSRAKKLVEEADSITTIHGTPLDDSLYKSKSFISFWAGPVGLIVFADRMEIYNHKSKVELDEIKGMSEKWWQYHKEYWTKKVQKADFRKMTPVKSRFRLRTDFTGSIFRTTEHPKLSPYFLPGNVPFIDS
jgi:hypothetical protein